MDGYITSCKKYLKGRLIQSRMGLPSLRDSPIGMGQTLRSSEQKRNAPDINVLHILFCTHTLDSALSFQWGYHLLKNTIWPVR